MIEHKVGRFGVKFLDVNEGDILIFPKVIIKGKMWPERKAKIVYRSMGNMASEYEGNPDSMHIIVHGNLGTEEVTSRGIFKGHYMIGRGGGEGKIYEKLKIRRTSIPLRYEKIKNN